MKLRLLNKGKPWSVPGFSPGFTAIGVLFVLLSLCVWPANVQADCSDAYGKAFINEFNTKSGDVEVYFKQEAPEGDYIVEVCNENEDDCEKQTFSFDGTPFLWVYDSFENIDNKDNFDITLYDSDGDVVDYINVHISQDERIFYNIDYEECDSIRDSIEDDEDSPHLIERDNKGQRQFYRTTDGGENWEETTHTQNNTYGTSNQGTEPPSLHHVRLEHDGTGITCMAERVTILACADADCTVTYNGEVTVDLTSPVSGWSSDPVTFSGGSITTIELRHTTAEMVTLAAEATSPTAVNPTVCVNSGVVAACELFFAEAGVLIDGDHNDDAPESAIVAQIAGKPSNKAPPSPALQQCVRIVRTDDQTGACVAGVSTETLEAIFQYLVPIADEGLDDNTITIAGNTSADLTNAGSGATVELAFDDNGTAPFYFTAADAGRYSLQVDLEIPVTDANGVPTGETIPATDTSNDFVVRPLALFADAAGNPSAQDADGDVYQPAGAAFSQTFTSLRWTAGRDGDNDGLWDDCGSSTLDDPGTPLARVPAWNIGQPAAALVLPAAGNDPGLSYGDGNVTLAAAADSVTADNVAYPEVGIIQFQGSVSGGFLNEPVGICSPYIGRFYPDHFITSISSNGSFLNSGTGFTYTGQPFTYNTAPVITITAQNVDNGNTLNYRDTFRLLTVNDVKLNYPTSDTATDGKDGATKMALSATPAAATLSTTNPMSFTLGPDWFTYTRTLPYDTDNARIGPFTSDLDILLTAVTDSDGVTANDLGAPRTISPTGIELRYGRGVATNGFGPETLPITLNVAAEFYDATGNWVVNPIDNSTSVPYAKTENAAEFTVTENIASPLTMTAGQEFLVLTPATDLDVATDPGGIIIIDYNYPAWLEPDQQATATFGIYRGNDRIINWQEIIQ
ncbi:MAG: hypothetical protein RI601_10855 [Desulfurivibrionaceae bacterium]|nr:hypothetical protein [Desulfurivibrionaceae bacterium]